MATKGYSFQDEEKTIIIFEKFEISKLLKCFRR